jgi:hypothetical protein
MFLGVLQMSADASCLLPSRLYYMSRNFFQVVIRLPFLVGSQHHGLRGGRQVALSGRIEWVYEP